MSVHWEHHIKKYCLSAIPADKAYKAKRAAVISAITLFTMMQTQSALGTSAWNSQHPASKFWQSEDAEVAALEPESYSEAAPETGSDDENAKSQAENPQDDSADSVNAQDDTGSDAKEDVVAVEEEDVENDDLNKADHQLAKATPADDLLSSRRSARIRTEASVVERFSPSAELRLKPYFSKAGVSYPPKALTLLAMKNERVLELWARDDSEFKFIRSYDIQGASGTIGPKLREGDRQVPEGIYKIIAMNPNSKFHLSMKLNYPNAFDRKHAQQEGRSRPGSNIFIHGKAKSIGCLAMGDETIEELFVLVSKTGMHSARVLIAPRDPRTRSITSVANRNLEWVPELYQSIATEFKRFQHEDI